MIKINDKVTIVNSAGKVAGLWCWQIDNKEGTILDKSSRLNGWWKVKVNDMIVELHESAMKI